MTQKATRTNWVYIMANRYNSAIYVGSTSDIDLRVRQHKSGEIKGHTKKYNLTKLVYFERLEDMDRALKREKQLKNWRREWKNDLIEANNPNWHDIFEVALEDKALVDWE
jgi:putative endonuclease